jgi:hypothetical protein
MKNKVDIVEKFLADNSPLPVYSSWVDVRAKIMKPAQQTTNNARDEILLCIDKDHCPHKLWKSSIGYYCGCKQRKTLPVTVARNRPRTILEA